jgi:hypothetical protein
MQAGGSADQARTNEQSAFSGDAAPRDKGEAQSARQSPTNLGEKHREKKPAASVNSADGDELSLKHFSGQTVSEFFLGN